MLSDLFFYKIVTIRCIFFFSTENKDSKIDIVLKNEMNLTDFYVSLLISQYMLCKF